MYNGRDRDEALVRRQLALGLSRAQDRGVRGAPRPSVHLGGWPVGAALAQPVRTAGSSLVRAGP